MYKAVQGFKNRTLNNAIIVKQWYFWNENRRGIVDYLNLDTEVLFFGTSASGAAALLGLKRVCFADKYE